MGWEWGGTPVGHFWKFARNPRSPLGILGIHWDSTGKGGSVISTAISSKAHLGYVVVLISMTVLKSRMPSIFTIRE